MNSLAKFLVKVAVITFITYAGVNNKDLVDISKALCIGLISSIVLSVLSGTPIYSEGYQDATGEVAKKVENEKAKEAVKQASVVAKKAVQAAKKAVAQVKEAKKVVTGGKKVVVKAAKTSKATVAKTKATPATNVEVRKAIGEARPTAEKPKVANKGKFPIRTKQEESKLSMQEQKNVDTIQVAKRKQEMKGQKTRVNKNYGYSFLEPSLWNLPMPDRRQCVAQRSCPVCPQSSAGTGEYLQLEGAKQLPPVPNKNQVA